MNSARHKCYLTASAYMQDCESLRNIKLAEENDPNQIVSPWDAIYCDNLPASRALTAQSQPYQKRLCELAYDFVSEKLGVCDDHPKRKNVPFLVQKAMDWNPPSNEKERFDRFLEKNLTMEECATALVSDIVFFFYWLHVQRD